MVKIFTAHAFTVFRPYIPGCGNLAFGEVIVAELVFEETYFCDFGPYS